MVPILALALLAGAQKSLNLSELGQYWTILFICVKNSKVDLA